MLKLTGTMSRRLLAIGALLASVLAGERPALADTVEDYLVQQVCDNGVGGHTNADPLTCPGAARKLQIGEALPYHKWDGPTASTAAQISDSYPIQDLFGRTRVVQTAYFDSQTSFVDPYFDASSAATGKSGYDLISTDGAYASAAGTYDPGRGWQPLWSNSGCSLADSWVYAPKNLAVPFSEGHTTSSLQNGAPQCPTVSSFGSSLAVWNFYPGYYEYESGKTLDTIKSWHFSGPTLNSDGFEVFYLTKQYGKTRWEAWDKNRSGPDSGALGRCPTGTYGGVEVFGSTTYYLADCHDWSNVVASPTGDWDPAANWHIDPLYNSVNLLKNTHMQCTNSSGIAQDCNAGGACQTIAPWNRLGALNWGFDSNLQGSTPTANCALQISFPNTWNGDSVYQDQPIGNGYSNYSYGTAMWLPWGGTASAYVAVYELNAWGGLVAQHSVGPVTVTGTPTYFQGSFTKDPATTRVRFQIYPQTQHAIYEFTESWVAPTP